MELGVFDRLDIQGSRGFQDLLREVRFQGLRRERIPDWLIMRNGDHAIGLFQGMFEKNMLTFNPDWDSNAQKLASFTDTRDLQRQLKAQGVQIAARGGRKHNRAGEFPRHGPGCKSDPVRSACVTRMPAARDR